MKSLRRDGTIILAAALLLHVLVLTYTCQVAASERTPPSLSGFVFLDAGSLADLSPGDNCPQSRCACIEAYLKAVPAPARTVLQKSNPDPEHILSFRRKRLVEQICIVMGQDARREAQNFIRELVLRSEWEGMSDGPQAEGESARRWLENHKRARIKPFVELFIAHRMRAAAEAAERGQAPELIRQYLDAYRSALDAARKSSPPLIACLAEDLESRKTIYLSSGFKLTLQGCVKAGERFERDFGRSFLFILEPVAGGWEIHVRQKGREENLARLTPPLHFAPNPREIEGWHLASSLHAYPSCVHAADMRPENPRRFIFSPEVGLTIDGPAAARSVTPREIETIGRYGRGALSIERFAFGPQKDGCPQIEWMGFSVEISVGY